jgi:hypothetical protein
MCTAPLNAANTLEHSTSTLGRASTPAAPLFHLTIDRTLCSVAAFSGLSGQALRTIAHGVNHNISSLLSETATTRCTALSRCPIRDLAILDEDFQALHRHNFCTNLQQTVLLRKELPLLSFTFLCLVRHGRKVPLSLIILQSRSFHSLIVVCSGFCQSGLMRLQQHLSIVNVFLDAFGIRLAIIFA